MVLLGLKPGQSQAQLDIEPREVNVHLQARIEALFVTVEADIPPASSSQEQVPEQVTPMMERFIQVAITESRV